MKKNGSLGICLFGLCMVAGLTMLYLSGAREKMINVSNTSANKELPICCVATDERQIALSFDADSSNEDTSAILEILAKHDVKASFFMTGEWVESFPEDVKIIQESGHDLGNHSTNHKQMNQMTGKQRKAELMTVHNKVKELTGVEMNLFRPPYSDFNDDVILDAKACGYYTVQWSIDSLDWKDYGADSIIKTVTQNEHLENGAIVLMHTGGKFTKDALDTLITTLQGERYEIVPISQLIYKENFHINHQGRQIKD